MAPRGKRGTQPRGKVYDRWVVDADYRPSDEERAQLAQVLGLPGYKVIERIALSVVASQKQSYMAILPADKDYERKVIEQHRRSQMCEALWEEIRQAIDKERTIINQPRELKTQPDPTEAAFADSEREIEELLGSKLNL